MWMCQSVLPVAQALLSQEFPQGMLLWEELKVKDVPALTDTTDT